MPISRFFETIFDERNDHGWSWIVAVCCGLVTFSTFGLNRASGVYYVGVRESYGVSREVASWPFSVCGAINCFSGVISGFLFHFFSLRQVIFGGVTLSILGLFLCYFANSIAWIVVCYGVVFGIGIGFTIVSMPLVINQYFSRHKTSGSGIYLAGGTLASFFIPPLAEYFLETYDLKGAFLVSAAIPVQALLFAVFLKSKAIKTPRAPVESEEAKPSLEKVVQYVQVPNVNQDEIEKEPLTPPEAEISQVYRSTTEVLPDKKFRDKFLVVIILCKNVLTNPMFGIITFSNVSCHFLVLTFSMIVVDFGLDKGLERSDAVLLASVVGIPELIGRLCFGWVSDKGYVSRKHLIVTSQIFAGSLLCIMTLAKEKYFLFTLCGLFGLALGNAFILINVFYMQIMKPEELGLAIAMKHFFTGFAFLLRPTITGLFRDYTGSYSYLLWMLGALSITAGAVWKFESYVNYNRSVKEVVKARKETTQMIQAVSKSQAVNLA